MQAAGDCGGGLAFASIASQQCWGVTVGQVGHNSTYNNDKN